MFIKYSFDKPLAGRLFLAGDIELARNYDSVLENIRNLLFIITGNDSYTFDIRGDLEKFQIRYGSNIVNVEALPNGYNIVIPYGNTTYEFYIDFYYTYLRKMTIEYATKTIIQEFSDGTIEISLSLEVKSIYMKVPFKTDFIVELSELLSLKEDTNLSDLRSFYLKQFYKYQSDYEKNEESTLGVKSILEDDSGYEETIVLSNNKIVEYGFSKIIGDMVVNVVSGDNGEEMIVITGYNSSVNVNEVVSDLQTRIQNIFNGNIIRFRKPEKP